MLLLFCIDASLQIFSVINMIYDVYLYKGSPLALSRSNSREGMASGSDSDNWRERNGSGLPIHSEFPSPISPKRKQNKTGVLFSQQDCINVTK